MLIFQSKIQFDDPHIYRRSDVGTLNYIFIHITYYISHDTNGLITLSLSNILSGHSVLQTWNQQIFTCWWREEWTDLDVWTLNRTKFSVHDGLPPFRSFSMQVFFHCDCPPLGLSPIHMTKVKIENQVWLFPLSGYCLSCTFIETIVIRNEWRSMHN